jgi:uncharacterized protein involved in exopolysaccharide biosynthesis
VVCSKEEDEINIYEVFLIIKKRVKLIISILLVALLLTGVVSYFMKPTFQSTFTVKAPSLSYSYSYSSSSSTDKAWTSDIAEKVINEVDLLKMDHLKKFHLIKYR